MTDFYDVWNASVENIKKQVTGVGVWTALNVAIPITLEDGVFVLGISEKEPESRGHLQTSNVRRIIEQELSRRIGRPIALEVIDGITINHWEAIKRRKNETDRLTKEAAERAKKSRRQATAWDALYEQLGRDFGKLESKALPQVRAQFLLNAADACAETRAAAAMDDDDERNFSRCLERISSYTEIPAALVAAFVLKRKP
ncbi:MAG TPA: hypothetical protein VFG65_08285 [Fimbriimonadales bacterium]|nr:hypothetical protein [Fimbriimonadales bacterium]